MHHATDRWSCQAGRDLLDHVSPVQWDNVTLYGAYEIWRELVVAHLRRLCTRLCTFCAGGPRRLIADHYRT